MPPERAQGVDKEALRTQMRERIAAVKPLQRAMEEELVNAAIMAEPAWRDATTVLLYKHKGPEFSVNSLANAAFRDGKRVCFPRVEGSGLVLHHVAAWTELMPGAFGLMEPPAAAPRVGPSAIECAIVPGLAWSKDGKRLGQGGGYYDRLLPVGGACFGVGFDCQLLEDLPVEPHDQAVDRVVTAANVVG